MRPASIILRLALLLIAGGLFEACSRQGNGQSPGHLYVTRSNLDPDKLASIWLMKRFIDPSAEFQLIDDVPLTKGLPFDVPEAEFRRYATMSCFESILQKHPIAEPGISQMAEIIHDLEVNYWGPKRSQRSMEVQEKIATIISEKASDKTQVIERSFALFDQLLAEFNRK
jgi:hypothetical protein